MAKTFGQVVRDRRTKIGISQEELAHRAGLHRTYVSMVERGIRTPTLQSVLMLAGALKTSMTTLVGELEARLGAKGTGGF